MEIDFDAAEEVSDFVTVPEGAYLCRIAEGREGTTRTGDERWSLRLDLWIMLATVPAVLRKPGP